MAVIEVHAKNKISIYELGDQGKGLDVEVDMDDEGNYGIWVGPRRSKTGRCLGNAPSGTVLDSRDIAAAMTEVGENEGWQTVKINGSTIWSSEAVEAVQEALGEDIEDGENEFDEE